MGTKLTPKILDRVKRLDAEGRSSREIAETLTRELGKPISRASVSLWLAGKGAKVKPSAAPTPTKVKPSKVAAPPAPPADELEVLTPEAMFAALGALMRSQDKIARQLAEEGDQVGSQKAVRLVVQLGAILAKQAKDEDEDDHVKVKADEMRAAADRGVLALHNIVERVQAERATWPRCTKCGQPHGEFAPGDKSTLRVIVERLFGRVL